MPHKFIKHLKGAEISTDLLGTGYMGIDWAALSPFQCEASYRLTNTVQIEQEEYLIRRPEVIAMTSSLISKTCREMKKRPPQDTLKILAENFTRPFEDIDNEIRKILKIPDYGPYLTYDRCSYSLDQMELDLKEDIRLMRSKYYPEDSVGEPSVEEESIFTKSSSFLSVVTSASTLPTPEPVPTPEPTLSQIFYKLVSTTLDKATFLKVTDDEIKYDTAYVELMKAVEHAMEIPVLEIKDDIAEMYTRAYEDFEEYIIEQERLAAELAWERRMRKKLKKTLRRQDNFKGYVTPPTPKSEVSSHASYKIPPPRPCKCAPQIIFNRYPKDRFGIYLPIEEEFETESVTEPPFKIKAPDEEDAEATLPNEKK